VSVLAGLDNQCKAVYNNDPKCLKEDERVAMDNYEYFKNNFDELYGRYKNKYIALKDCKVIGFYDSFAEAIEKTAQSEKLGTFSVQHCSREEIDGYNFYNGNVVFGIA